MSHVYPLTIIAAKYGGDIEGAQFIALNELPDSPVVAWTISDRQTVALFFRSWAHPIGRGSNPDDALHDLLRQLEQDPQ